MDVAGYSELAGAGEERTLARLRAFCSGLIYPTIALRHGRVVKRLARGHRNSRAANSSSNALASFRSRVSNPSANQTQEAREPPLACLVARENGIRVTASNSGLASI